MLRFLVCVFSIVVLTSATAVAEDESITIVTRDGQTISGRLVTETSRGFLVALPNETVLVEYGRMMQVTRNSSAPAAFGSPAPASHRDVDLGFGGGVTDGPTLSAERLQERFFEAGPVLQLPIEIPGERLGVRITPTFTLGFAGDQGVWRKFGELSVDTQLRVHLTRMVSVGIGAFIGIGASSSGLSGDSEVDAYGVVGPSLTPVDLRFGDTRQHELQLWVGMTIDFGSGGSGADAVRPVLTYTFHF